MWISVLNLKADTDYEIHKEIYSFFTERVELFGRDFCFKVDEQLKQAVVYSPNKIKEDSVWLELKKHDEFAFSLICCPGKGTYRDENGVRKRSTHRKNIDDVYAWLNRRFQGSAEIVKISGRFQGVRRILKPCGNKLIWPFWEIEGRIKVLQPISFETILTTGVGQGSGFGMGQIQILSGE
jgi:hypothetical protein